MVVYYIGEMEVVAEVTTFPAISYRRVVYYIGEMEVAALVKTFSAISYRLHRLVPCNLDFANQSHSFQ